MTGIYLQLTKFILLTNQMTANLTKENADAVIFETAHRNAYSDRRFKNPKSYDNEEEKPIWSRSYPFDIDTVEYECLVFVSRPSTHPLIPPDHRNSNSRAGNRLHEFRPDLLLQDDDPEIFEKTEFVRNRAKPSGIQTYQKKTFSTIPRQFECYSCMSLSYQDSWEHLQYMYTTPKVFTNRCNEPFIQKNIPTVLCGSFCASLLEPNVEAGVFLGYKYIRGCVDRILRHGFNQSALRTHRFNQLDLCRSLPRAQLFNAPQGLAMPIFGDVQLCSCYGDKCNGASAAPSKLPTTYLYFALKIILLPFLSFIFINTQNNFFIFR